MPQARNLSMLGARSGGFGYLHLTSLEQGRPSSTGFFNGIYPFSLLIYPLNTREICQVQSISSGFREQTAAAASRPLVFVDWDICSTFSFLYVEAGKMIPHRSTGLLAIIVFVALLLFIFSSSPIPEPTVEDGEEPSGAAKYVPRPKLPSLSNPFRATSHEAPPEQANSTSGESKWFSHWEWLNPFSSAITLDENRSVLPPLRERRPIYTYYNPKYNPKKQQGKGLKDNQIADAELLLAWRRAWFAQGFRPVVLTPGDAMKNPHYQLVQNLKLTSEMENEVFRWLAWGHMGTGLLADFHCFPMARYDDALLSSLRRGTAPEFITRFDNFQGGLYSAEKGRLNEAIDTAVKKLDEKSTSLADLMAPEIFKVEQPTALAYYTSSSITSRYPKLHEKLSSPKLQETSSESPSSGRLLLVQLINSHLHNTFQNAYPAGLAVLKPFPHHTTALVEPALRLAKALVQCPESPVPDSCPPNRPDCRPCGSAKQPMLISQPSSHKNTTFLFTIGTLPHPYTLLSLQKSSSEVTTRQLRRETGRDAWLTDVTQDQLGPELGGSYRALVFKNFVGGDQAAASALWMTVESLPAEAGQSLPSELLDEFEWQFGFKIPRGGTIDPNTAGDKESVQNKNPSQQGVAREYELIQQARAVIRDKDSNRASVKNAAEAWNLADTEVWRFVKAYRYVSSRSCFYIILTFPGPEAWSSASNGKRRRKNSRVQYERQRTCYIPVLYVFLVTACTSAFPAQQDRIEVFSNDAGVNGLCRTVAIPAINLWSPVGFLIASTITRPLLPLCIRNCRVRQVFAVLSSYIAVQHELSAVKLSLALSYHSTASLLSSPWRLVFLTQIPRSPPTK